MRRPAPAGPRPQRRHGRRTRRRPRCCCCSSSSRSSLGLGGFGGAGGVQNSCSLVVAPTGLDRAEHVRLRGRRHAARLDPGRAEPPAGLAVDGSALDGEGDDRDRGPPLLPARRRRLARASRAPLARHRRRARSSRAARRSRSSSSATSTRSRASGRSQRKIKEACLAIKLSDKWSKDRILATWMNQVYFGNHAYGVEAAAQTYFSKHAEDLTLDAGGAARRAAAGAVALRPVPSAATRARAPGRGAASAMLDNGDITRRAVPARASRDHGLHLTAGTALHADPRAVLLQLRPRPADRRVRREHGALGRAPGLHDDRPARSSARAEQAISGHAEPARRPGGRRSSRSTRRTARSGR